MKFCNNPTRKLERRMGALKRMCTKGPAILHLVGADKEARQEAVVARYTKERDALALRVHAEPHNEVRRHRTKKDRTSRAKLRFGDQQ